MIIHVMYELPKSVPNYSTRINVLFYILTFPKVEIQWEEMRGDAEVDDMQQRSY